MKHKLNSVGALAICALVVLGVASLAVADQGTVVKWSQPPVLMDPIPPGPPMAIGEDFPSDIDWRIVPMTFPPPDVIWPPDPNWNVADDFRSDGRPILTVRWWGSYFPSPTVPVAEDGYILSFFSDVPALPTGGFSHPGDLLGTYVAPIGAVTITPTDYVDWGNHRVYEYEVNLQDTHLFHPSDIADPIAFREREGVIYWLSIVAENGAVLDPATWEFVHNNDPIPHEHFWGWLTRPHFFNDVPTMSHLWMPPGPLGPEWLYDAWEPIHGQHVTFPDMTFELLTIPEPASVYLMALGLVAVGWYRVRRQA